MSSEYAITISPETNENTETYLQQIADKMETVLGLIRLHIVHEMGEEKNHPHLHCICSFDSKIPLQTLYPRLKKVFGFIPKLPLVKCSPLKSLVDLESFMHYLHTEEGSYLVDPFFCM